MNVGALELAQDLIRFPSVTPDAAGSLSFIATFLENLGFETTHLPFGEVENLFAKRGEGSSKLCFVGHVDVVPPGDRTGWRVDPFAGVVQDGILWGRGAVDMKGAIACFLASVAQVLKTNPAFQPPISLLLTSDEEGPAVDGVQRVMPWLQSQGEIPNFFLIGEPTGLETVGNEIKVGRRGSFTGKLTFQGEQGHIAYPSLADNPIPRLLACGHALASLDLDKGNAYFEPSRLEVTSVDVGNPVTNLIPAQASLRFGVRFNTQHHFEELEEKVREVCEAHAGDHQLTLTHHGDPFLTQAQGPIQSVVQAVQAVTGKAPVLGTSGGTSDGRFLTRLAPVIECGLPEDTIHQVNEHVQVKDLEKLYNIYKYLIKYL